MVSCPSCKTEVYNIIKEWTYRKGYYQVKAYKCPQCTLNFKAYFHENLFSHTIPLASDSKSIIIRFLKNNDSATEIEIAQKLGIDVGTVTKLLLELEKEGRVSPV